jgi:hypothetical protein
MRKSAPVAKAAKKAAKRKKQRQDAVRRDRLIPLLTRIGFALVQGGAPKEGHLRELVGLVRKTTKASRLNAATAVLVRWDFPIEGLLKLVDLDTPSAAAQVRCSREAHLRAAQNAEA